MTASFTIGKLKFAPPTVLAPLAGITNLPFRLLAKQAGCGLVVTEMVSAKGLWHRSPKTFRLLESHPAEKPLSVQLFGAEPEVVAMAAAAVEAAGADIVDINFGCAVKKVVKTGSGVALMRDPGRAAALLQAVRKAVTVPLTIKIRSGWDGSGKEALEIAEIAAEAGVDAIAVHPRTAAQGFRGQADWSVIRAVKRTVSMPVIGNGDIQSAPDALRMMSETGCDAVMIGRAAIGNPLIFEEILAAFRGGSPSPPSLDRRFSIMERYVRDSASYLGEENACRMMRSRLCWFVKGLPHSARFRDSIRHIATVAEAREQLDAYKALLLAS